MKKNYRKFLTLLMILIAVIFTSCSTMNTSENIKPTQEIVQPKMDAVSEEAKVETKINVVKPMPVEDKTLQMVDGVFVSADKYGNMLTSISASQLEDANLVLGDLVDVNVEGTIYTCPIVSTYSDVDVGEFLIRVVEDEVYFCINYGNCQKKTGADTDIAVSISLNEAGAYLLEYETRHLTKSEDRADYVSDEVFANFRNIATKNITPGILYRSCSPSLGDARTPYADKLAENVDIKTIVNLADSKESLMKSLDPNSWYMNMYNNNNVILLDMDVDYSSVEFGQSLAKGFKFIAANEPPFLIHCNEGKDRAGFASVIIEALMGASLDEITADYMISYYNYYGVEKGTSQYDYIATTPYKMLETISEGLAVTDNNLYSIAYNYMIKNGVTQSEVVEIMGKLI